MFTKENRHKGNAKAPTEFLIGRRKRNIIIFAYFNFRIIL